MDAATDGCDQKLRTRDRDSTRSVENTGRRENLENRKAVKPELCRLRSCFPAFQIYLFHRASRTLLYRRSAISRSRLLPSAWCYPRARPSPARRNSRAQLRATNDRHFGLPPHEIVACLPPADRRQSAASDATLLILVRFQDETNYRQQRANALPTPCRIGLNSKAN